MNNKLYSSLENIAKESLNQSRPTEQATDNIKKNEIKHLNKVLQDAESMYPLDKEQRFNYWKKSIDISNLSPEAKTQYWNQYVELHPKGVTETKKEYLNILKNELQVISGYSNKEFFLRDRLASAPAWAKESLEPELAKVSTLVANSNYTKATKVYEQDAKERINTFLFKTALDPDVSIEDHTNDLIKLEQLNLLDVAKTINGRVGIYSEENQKFIPSFALSDRNQAFANDPYGAPSLEEQLKVKETISPFFKQAVEANVYMARRDITREEQQANTATQTMLEQGKFTVDQWHSAFSINPEADAETQIVSGIKGEIASKRVKSYGDLAQTIYSALNNYGSMIGVNKNVTE